MKMVEWSSHLGACLVRSSPIFFPPSILRALRHFCLHGSAGAVTPARLRFVPLPVLPSSRLRSTSQSFFHVDCFKCAKCCNQVTADTNLLLLSDGSPICASCSYSCNVCQQPILDEAIMTGEDSYHAHCFKCKVCKNRIDELVFAKTSQGIYCMNCHNQRVARSRRHAQRQREKEREREREREKAANTLTSSDAAKAEQAASVSDTIYCATTRNSICISRVLRRHRHKFSRPQRCLKRLYLSAVSRIVGQCLRSIRRRQPPTHRMNLVNARPPMQAIWCPSSAPPQLRLATTVLV